MVALRVHRQWMHVVSPRTAAFCRREFSGLPTPLQSFAALQTTLRVGSRPRAIPSQTEPPPGTSAERDRHCPPDMAAEFISPFVEPVPMAAVPQHLLPSLFGLPAHAMPASSSCVYYSDNASLPEKAANATRFVCISDTHTHTDQVRSADFRLFFSCENDFALAQGPAGRRADPRRRLHLHGCNR